MDNNILEINLELARKGRVLWLSLIEKYAIDYDTIVYIMPHEDLQLNSIALFYKEQVLKSKRATRFLMICTEKSKNGLSENGRIILSDDEMDALMKYNDMAEFSSQVYIISFVHGSDHNAEILMKTRGFSREELIYVGLLNLVDYKGDSYGR